MTKTKNLLICIFLLIGFIIFIITYDYYMFVESTHKEEFNLFIENP